MARRKVSDLRAQKEKPLRKLSELTNQPPILEFEGFILRPFDGHTLWLEHPSGEGTQLSKVKFLGFLMQLFADTF